MMMLTCYVVSLSSSNAARLQGPRSYFGGADYAATNFGGKVFGMWKCLFSPPLPVYAFCKNAESRRSAAELCVCVLICRQMCSRHLHQMIIPPFGETSTVGS
jgi:hypothetical protein